MIEMTNIDEVAVRLAGVAGALVSMRFLHGKTRTEKFSLFISGSIASYYGSPFLAELTSIPEGFMGFLAGVFGMAIVARIWEAVQAFPVGLLWQAVVDRVRGK